MLERGSCQARNDLRFAQQLFRSRFKRTLRHLNHAHRVFRRHELRRSCLYIDLSSSEARKNQRAISGYQVRTIQLRGDVSRQAATAQRGRGELRIRRRRQKIPTKRKEDFRLSVVHRVNYSYRIKPMITWRLKTKFFSQSV